MSESVFKPENLKPFRWAELADKTLTIRIGRDSGFIRVIGVDENTGKMYGLHFGKEAR